MSLQKDLIDIFNLSLDQIDGHETDLYILPKDKKQLIEIRKWLVATKPNTSHTVHISDVPDQLWYGKTFIEIPFMRYL